MKTDLVNQSEQQYREGEFAAAELTLMRAARKRGLSAIDKERIFDRLAGLATEQGLFSSASFWYLKVLKSRADRLKVSDPELLNSLRNYKILLRLAQRSAPNDETAC